MRFVTIIVFLLSTASISAQCTLPNCHDLGQATVFDGSGGPFLAGHTYVFQTLTVPAGETLTVAAGAILKFRNGPSSRADIRGTLDVQGTAAQPVIVTSFRDDVGGDHNGDGSTTTPAPGAWSGIDFFLTSTDCDLEWCEIRYAVTAIEASGPATVPLDLRHVTTSHSQLYGFRSADARPGVVDACAFNHGLAPVWDLRYYEVEAFTGCTAVGGSQGDAIRLNGSTLDLFGTRSWSPLNTFNGSGVIHLNATLEVQTSASLSLAAGMIIKMGTGRRFEVRGDLQCLGTAAAPVVFTTADDDSVGGDTTGNGPTTGASGSWDRLVFFPTAGNSSLIHTEVRFAAGSTGAADDSGAGITVTNCRFADASQYGLRIAAGTTIIGCSFENNGDAVFPVPVGQISNFSNCTASGNAGGDVMSLGSGVLSSNTTLNAASAFNGNGTFALRGTVTIGNGATLNVSPGVIVKADPAVSSARFDVQGTLFADASGAAPIVFTSLRDDTAGGDTNGDGAMTTPSPGDWSGLRFFGNSDASVLDNVRLRYGGRGGSAALRLSSSDMSIRDTTVAFSLGPGLEGGSSVAAITSCSFDNCDTPMTDIDIEALPLLSQCTALGNTRGDVIRIGDGTLTGTHTLSPANTLNGSGVLIFENDLIVAGDLTFSPGMVAKFTAPSNGVTVTGTLTCPGAAGASVVLTSVHDDSFGGDSAADGPTTGSPGDWRGVASTLAPFTASHTIVRFAGGGGMAGAVATGGMSLSDCTFHASASAGLDMMNVIDTTKSVTNCHFTACTFPIARATFAGLSQLTGNTATASTAGDFLSISARGGALGPTTTIDIANTINGNGIVFVNAPIQAPAPTTIGPGMVFKFASGAALQSDSARTLDVQGTAASPVVFTSRHDDTYGGADGDVTSAGKGDWPGLEFLFQPQDDSVLSHVVIRYAGEGGRAAVLLNDADTVLRNVVIEESLGAGLDTSFNSSPTLENPDFRDNCGAPIDGLTWAVLANMTGARASGNGGPATSSTVIVSDVVDGHLTIERDNYFGDCIVVMTTPTTTAGVNTLSFGRGVVVKCAAGVGLEVFEIHGTGYEKTVFTSLVDDSIVGDTNGDGASTSPAPGDWQGLSSRTPPTALPAGRIEHALVRYAETGIAWAPEVRSSRAEFCADLGFDLTQPNDPTFLQGIGESLIAFSNGDTGIRGLTIRNATAVRNGTYGIDAAKAVYCISWNNGLDEYSYTSDHVLGPNGTDVIHSCGTSLSVGPPVAQNGNCGSSGWGNIDVDPLFVDEVNGDLRLSAASPVRNYALQPCPLSILSDASLCKPWGPTGQGYPEALSGTRDFRDGPRPSDDDLSGPNAFRADLGALERRVHELVLFGDLELGAATAMAIAGPAGETGTAYYLLGTSGPDLIVPGWGVILIDLATLFAVETLPLPGLYVIQVPDLPLLGGLEIAFQALVVPSGEAVGSCTETYRGRFHF